ncbi:MAG: glycine betaine ABC transporter substrate-binding protein [Acidimicrobiia bacterium]
MRKYRTRVFGAALLAVALLAAACGSGEGTTIIVGSTNFPEQEILGEIYAQVLEAEGYPVEKKFQLGSREVVEPAIEAAEIGLYAEYVATVLSFLARPDAPRSDIRDVDAAHAELTERFADRGVMVLDYAPAIDANAIVVTKATADQLGLAKVSDLVPHAGQLVFGGPPECPTREFCEIGLRDVYGIEFAEFRPLDVGGPITVTALATGEIDVALLFSSDGAIAANGFVVLEDDRHLQGADNIVPVVRLDLVDEYGSALTDLIDRVTAKITTSELSQMNRRVNIDLDDPSAVARDWLVTNGFIDA